MTGAERGFLLLTCQLGNPERKVLSVAQLRNLGQRVKQLPPFEPDRDLEEADLVSMGYGRDMAQRILALLDENDLLEHYLRAARRADCVPLTRKSPDYPQRLRRLDPDAPGCLWAKGDLSLLNRPGIALVGSRALREPNRIFAREAGRQAAAQGYVLISGNARGADQTAQEAALEAGGSVISIVADSLAKLPLRENVLWLSETGFDLPFSKNRALSRNRVIHALGLCTLAAQSDLGTGGTWDGSVHNLQHHWSPLGVFQDGSDAANQLCSMGAAPVGVPELCNLAQFTVEDANLFSF